jgi:hypothetical protein
VPFQFSVKPHTHSLPHNCCEEEEKKGKNGCFTPTHTDAY